ncbi:fibronectin type III domain-containing protein [Sulfurimonas paralvinellae]|uniref:Fibronectin type III domain-containing protein n=1 Tax=Sulfurimonas paralvinellae TaxID=317658 RepID=A0A7M1B6K5_9BACT|nr:fibronectin type III domain-containing protein [Sulfurimonas paralvinellae]QOP45367.1 fibronectin type III domain-containing protein [Sulfurimonas paralvinellae]
MKFSILTTLFTASLLLFSGCAEITPTPKEEVVVDSTLPTVTLTKNGIITDMKTVAFEWKSITDPRVTGIYVYKKSPEDKKETKELEYYDTIDTRYSTHYVDRNVDPDKKYSYAFRVFAKNAQGVNSKVFVVNTLPVLQSVSWIHSIGGLPRIAKIIWRPHVSERVASYIIERKTFEDKEWHQIDELSGRLNAEYIDTGLEDNHVYMYRIRVKTYDGIISTPSQIVKAVTKPLPKSVAKIEATKNLPKMIKLNWTPSKQKDFDRYYLYRSDDVDGSYELIAKLYNPKFTDKIDEDGKVYFYQVSVVDKDGLESEHEKTTVMGRTLVKPKAPAIVEAKLLGSKIELKWGESDPRTVSYIVVKKSKKGWFDEVTKEYKGIKKTLFIDSDIEADTLYTYTVYSVDKNSIVSEPSIEVQIKTPESKEIVAAPKTKATEQKVAQPVKSSSSESTVAPAEELDLNGL